MHIFSDVCAIFNVSPRTLYRWCNHAFIIPHQDPADMRRRYLDNDQLLKLARLHNRVLMVESNGVQLSAIERMQRQIDELNRKLSEQ